MSLICVRSWRSARFALSLACGSLCGAVAFADDGDHGEALPKLAADVTAVPFDELMMIEVTSVSKRAEPAGSAAAAVFVLTGAEIRRAGVRSIAEALRLVPGLQVAQRSGIAYAISARGFSNVSADKLEVLLDGRSVYTPLTSTVYWDVLDVYLPDIDRIEVIRGPGAALWGSNAVNGVINIITRSASDTTGISAEAHGGTEERYGAAAQFGTRLGEHGAARIYAKVFDRDDSKRADGGEPIDGMRKQQAGFRSDWDLSGGGTFTFSGDGYRTQEKVGMLTGTIGDFDSSGGNVLARYSCCAEEQGRWSLQTSYDGHNLNAPTILVERITTAAVDAQQQWQWGRNTFVYGLGYRYSHDQTGGPPNLILLDPAARNLTTYSSFVQDQIALAGNALTITLGSKFEHNSFSGFEVQPSIRAGWQASPSVFTWASISRAVRTPNLADQDVAIYCPEPDGFPGICGPGLFRIGNPELDSEKLVAYEWGLRVHGAPRFSWDLATYYNHYTSLKSTELTPPPFGAYANKLRAESYGAELSVLWQPTDALQLRPFYSLLVLNAWPASDSTDAKTASGLEGSNPRHQAGLAVSWTPSRWTVGGLLRYVDGLSQSDSADPANPSSIPAYVELDVHVARELPYGLQLGLYGQNLLHPHHPEFGNLDARAELQRGAYVELRWNW